MRMSYLYSKLPETGVPRHIDTGGAAMHFFNVLTGPELIEITEAHWPEHRERLYPPTVALSMFLRQTLATDGSSQRAVNAWAADCVAEGLSPQSVRTGGYCRAPQRLPLSMVQALTGHSAQRLKQRAPGGWRWRGRSVKLLDGTGISMPDTAQNQAVFPQPVSQAAGVGFPLARLCALIIWPVARCWRQPRVPMAASDTANLSCRARCSVRSRPGTCCWPMRCMPTRDALVYYPASYTSVTTVRAR